MRMCWKILALLLVGTFVSYTVATDFDEDDDEGNGVVEDEPEIAEPVVMEKQNYEPPMMSDAHLAEPFHNTDNWKKRWIHSQAKKDDVEEDIAKYDGKWSMEEPKELSLIGDMGLVVKSKAKHHAIASKLQKTYEFKGNPLIVSYEVKFQNGIDCGGAYIKLLSKQDKLDLKTFHDKTPYSIMFGPDKCGLDHKLHFIFRHKNPKTGEFEEKHAKKPSGSLDKYFTDKKTHLYTLVVNPDNSFEVLVDNKVVNSGSLLADVSPPVNPPGEIDDPDDKKPSEWDEREKIANPDAVKPEDWDEDQPKEVPDVDAVKPEGWLDDEEALKPDPDAERPEDWDQEMDGEWEAPLIDNPMCKDAPGCGEWIRPNIPNSLYKGKWKPDTIDNPNYQGEWAPKKITNPNFFEDLTPYKMTAIDALGLELWSMSDDIMFDNFIVTDDREIHARWVEQTWDRKTAAESASAGGQGAFVQGILDITRDRPWLWAVFLIVIVLPIILVIAYCCTREKQEDIDAARKKTDEASPDDEKLESKDTEEEKPDVDAGGDNEIAKTKKSKASLEKEEQEEEEEEEEDASQEEEDANDGDGSEEQKDDTDAVRRSPRKRKTRKD